MAKIINGRIEAEKLLESVKKKSDEFFNLYNEQPRLDIILVGENKASLSYIKSKIRKAKQCNFICNLHQFGTDVNQQEILECISSLNTNAQCHGIIVQLPLPNHICPNIIADCINYRKDVDGFTPSNLGMSLRSVPDEYYLECCTPKGIIYLIENIHGEDLSAMSATIIGRSNIVGKPLASLLINRNATVTICNSSTKDLAAKCKDADILISATGKALLVNRGFVKPGATIIDVGINHISDDNGGYKIVGDVDFDDVFDIAGHITPVPGGVGPMTVAMLMFNTLKAACLAQGASTLIY